MPSHLKLQTADRADHLLRGTVDLFGPRAHNGRAVDPKIADRYHMRRRFFRIVVVRSRAKRAARDENMFARRFLEAMTLPRAENTLTRARVTGVQFPER